jgi:hypothetical protein
LEKNEIFIDLWIKNENFTDLWIKNEIFTDLCVKIISFKKTYQPSLYQPKLILQINRLKQKSFEA